MSRRYEELRQAAIDVILERKPSPYPPNQFGHLAVGVAYALADVTPADRPDPAPNLFGQDKTLLLEVFWDLFRDGIITIGSDGSNDKFPHFRLARFAAERLAGTPPYHFHNVQTYESVVRQNIPAIDDITLRYAAEGMRAFSANCMLAAAVMIGVATEHVFLLVVESAEKSKTHGAAFAPVSKERAILQKVNKFKRILEAHLAAFPAPLKEGLDTRFAGVLETIRKIRNESGHPTGEVVGRETVYILLQLFIPYCKKMRELIEYFRGC